MRNYTILYVHGMGGGVDSRIPSILNLHINSYIAPKIDAHIDVIVRTYDIDPSIAWNQITSWRNELKPDLVIGESLGSLHAIQLKGVPHLFVSPAIGAARWMAFASWLPGAAGLMRMMFKPHPGSANRLISHIRSLVTFAECGKGCWTVLRKKAEVITSLRFGTDDTYRRSGVVSVRNWAKYFGPNSYKIYKGTHYMEEEYLYSMLIPKILEVLGLPMA